MKTPLVSIIIPVYNGENYLRDAIDSALKQSYSNCEVIVVNDGSTDSTDTICKSYSNQICYFCKDNGGVSSALNLGLHKMNGEYFTWLAHDDLFYLNKIECQIAALEQATDKTSIVHSNYNLLNVRAGVISHMHQEESYTVEQLTNSVFPLLMTTVHASTPLIHKSHFERVGNFNENLPLTQDYDFLFRAMRNKQSIFIPEPLLLSRLHDQSGKNTDNRFGRACSKQYINFANSLTYDEVCTMFTSPRAFYFRLVAMIKARYDMPESNVMLNEINKLPTEITNNKLYKYIHNISDGKSKTICIFGTGYHGKVLKFELEHRDIQITCFCDNNKNIHGKFINDIPCISLNKLALWKDNTLVIIATDVSDIIEMQLIHLGFKFITTKKKLDALILESPPSI